MTVAELERTGLDAVDRRILVATQGGLPLVPRPYHAVAERLGLGPEEVMRRMQRLLDRGAIRRVAAVPNHYALGFRANGMSVWDVPDAVVAQFGSTLAGAEGVTLAYARARGLPEWPYNLYCMIHGTERRQVAARIEALNRELGLEVFPHAVLFSRTRFKQTGPRFSSTPEVIHG